MKTTSDKRSVTMRGARFLQLQLPLALLVVGLTPVGGYLFGMLVESVMGVYGLPVSFLGGCAIGWYGMTLALGILKDP